MDQLVSSAVLLVYYLTPHIISLDYPCRFINEEALACELAGHFFLKVGDNETAIQYFLQAHEKYHEWGAVAKSNLIFEFVQKNLAAPISPSPSVNNNNLPSQSIEEDTNRRKRGAD